MKILDNFYKWLDKKTKRTDGKVDYCSASPDKLFGVDISEACRIHDEHYNNKNVSKEEADIQLRENIISIGQNKFKFKIAGWVYYLGVKYFGAIYKW